VQNPNPIPEMKLMKRLWAAIVPPKPPVKPVKFPEVNFTYTTPATMTKEQCGDLPCFRSSVNTVSCWHFGIRDRILILITGRVWLFMMMDGHPPSLLMAESPFPAPADAKTKGKFWIWMLVVICVLQALGVTYFLLSR
jgi:hypothetical protein